MSDTNTTWQDFWKEWRAKKAENEQDLYFQVGRTVAKKPVAKEIFDFINEDIIATLALGPTDVLIDFCCGNGLCTYEYKDKVKQIIAVDFAPHLIEAARKFKSAPNITYCQQDLFGFLEHFTADFGVTPTKYLMNGALPYFEPEGLEKILTQIGRISPGSFMFMITTVPNKLLLHNYYNTPERMNNYLENVAKGDITNEGMGRWWLPAEIEQICAALGLNYSIRNDAPEVSDYRMDILISSG